MGNTALRYGICRRPAVHPHACGEYSRTTRLRTCFGGSSPRLWGIRDTQYHLSGVHRFIPTPVGNTLLAGYPRCPGLVHPHACGEYLINFIYNNQDDGSSPRLWGILNDLLMSVLSDRFIPTPVGNTLALSEMASRQSVHPHACGEYAILPGATDRCLGSSPRLWGIRSRTSSRKALCRFIPTPVGNTSMRSL